MVGKLLCWEILVLGSGMNAKEKLLKSRGVAGVNSDGDFLMDIYLEIGLFLSNTFSGGRSNGSLKLYCRDSFPLLSRQS